MEKDHAARARRLVARRCHEGLTAPALAEALTDAIATAVPIDEWCWHTIDPATLMLTGAIRPNFSPDPRFGRYEYSVPDVNKFAHLAGRRRRAGVLSDATHGHLETSARYRDLLRPLGIGHELRAAFVVDESCWAACALYRHLGGADFTVEEAELVASMSTVVAEGFRRALLIGALDDRSLPRGPGLVLLDDADETQSITPEARHWLGDVLDVGGHDDGPLPAPVYAVAARARAAADGALDEEDPARVQVQTTSGRWITLHASRLDAKSDGLTAVIVEPSQPAEIAPVIVRAYGLSERERSVARLVLQGRSTREIAESLHLSPLTIQDHLKSIFDKVGVRSRRELVAQVFAEHYAPRVARGERPVATGYFD